MDLTDGFRKSGAHRVSGTDDRYARPVASITTTRCSALRLTILVSIVVASIVRPAGQQLMPRGGGAPRSIIILPTLLGTIPYTLKNWINHFQHQLGICRVSTYVMKILSLIQTFIIATVLITFCMRRDDEAK